MAKILIVSANLKDWTKDSGGKERTATLAEALSDHEITFLSFSWYNEQINKKITNNIHQIQPGLRSSIEKRRRTLIKSIAQPNHDIVFEMLKDELEDFSKLVKDLAKESDLLIIDHYSISPLVQGIKDIPIIYNSHNSEISMAKQLYENNRDVMSLVEKMERDVLKKSKAITYCSEKDFKELSKYYGGNIQGKYIPNGATKQNKINYTSRLKSRDIIFVGSGHPPNNLAAKSVTKIAKNLPEFNFIIIGDCGNSLKEKNYSDNVKILGRVDDKTLINYFETAFAFINPMESGSGTHLKMMKALSYGIPIVSSNVGARGFSDEEINESMLIANDNDETINQILKLKNEKIYRNLCEEVYNVSKKYNWENIKKEYADFINTFLINIKPLSQSTQKEKILICSIIRNDEHFIDNYYNRLKAIVSDFKQYDFYLSIYENDSTDNTKQKIMSKDFSMFSGFSFISENLNTKYYGSVKDEDRVKNLANARNKALLGGGFLELSDYVLMIDIDVEFKMPAVEKILSFKNLVPDFDIVASATKRKRVLYDQWATREGPKYDPAIQELFESYKNLPYKKYYSVSSGFCLYRSEPFKNGTRYDYINMITKEADCEMVVICQAFKEKGYDKIYMSHEAEMFHNHK